MRPGDAEADWRVRLERAERHIERALIDVTTLRSDLATLVGSVEDIRKRMSRAPVHSAAVMQVPARPSSWRRTVAVIVLLVAAGVALWGFYVAASAVPAPAPISSESSSAPPSSSLAPRVSIDSPQR